MWGFTALGFRFEGFEFLVLQGIMTYDPGSSGRMVYEFMCLRVELRVCTQASRFGFVEKAISSNNPYLLGLLRWKARVSYSSTTAKKETKKPQPTK